MFRKAVPAQDATNPDSIPSSYYAYFVTSRNHFCCLYSYACSLVNTWHWGSYRDTGVAVTVLQNVTVFSFAVNTVHATKHIMCFVYVDCVISDSLTQRDDGVQIRFFFAFVFISIELFCLIQLAHQLMHTHKNFYIKTFKIAPTCFDSKIILRELHCSLLKSHF